jgi:hypothetical protein
MKKRDVTRPIIATDTTNWGLLRSDFYQSMAPAGSCVVSLGTVAVLPLTFCNNLAAEPRQRISHVYQREWDDDQSSDATTLHFEHDEGHVTYVSFKSPANFNELGQIFTWKCVRICGTRQLFI